MTTEMAEPAAPSTVDTGASPREMRRILMSSFLGTAIEYYDFILYVTAAGIVFNKVFFAALPETTALIVSFGTLAVGYVARPLGGLLFGHLGDRLGRKAILLGTVLLMGISSTAIGLLPTPEQIGVLAPILLVVLRFVQGLAVGGEWGGAMLLAFEQAKRESRGFAASFAYLGAPAGTIVGTLMLSAMATLPPADFLAWGWRIPFVLSVVFMALVIFIRVKVSESRVFTESTAKPRPKRVPALELLAEHPRSLGIGILSGLSGQMAQGLMGAWAISYAVQQAVLSPSSVLNVKALGGIFTILMVVIAARASDRIGRRPILLAGNIGAILLVFPVLWLLGNGGMLPFLAAIILGLSVIQGFTSGPYGAYAAELFPTHIRYSGSSICYQFASTLGAGFTPMIATALVVAAGGSLWMVGVLWVSASAISLVAVFLSRDRSRVELSELDAPAPR